jgi:hypothetical protein
MGDASPGGRGERRGRRAAAGPRRLRRCEWRGCHGRAGGHGRGCCHSAFLHLGLRRWAHRAQPLSRREREIPSSASGRPWPGLPRGNLTVAVFKSRLQMYTYTTGCWEQLSQTQQKRLVDAVADGVALGDARGANPTLTMSHLPLHRSSLASRMFAGVKQFCGVNTALGQLSPGSRAALGRCEELVQEGGHRRWPSVGNISRASVQADIVVETGLPYAATLALRRSNIQGQAKAERQRKKKRKCGEREEEDDG